MLKLIILLSVFVLCTARPSDDFSPKNVVTVPPNCPEGQQWVNGQCRDIWRSTFNVDHQYQLSEAENSDDGWPKNVITVPPNCRPGQQWINGACRDIWRKNDVMPSNVVTVPPNCPDGQEYVNGECRDIWKSALQYLQKLVYGSMYDTSGDMAKLDEAVDTINEMVDSLNKNIINVPNQCPAGSRPDGLGICRPIFD